jgi:hypothetical protein
MTPCCCWESECSGRGTVAKGHAKALVLNDLHGVPYSSKNLMGKRLPAAEIRCSSCSRKRPFR